MPPEAHPAPAEPAPAPAEFVRLGEEEGFRGWRISVVDATVRGPDGTEFHRDVVRHPGAVAVVPVTEEGVALLVRQYRAPLDRWILEIPAGTRDVEGEAPEIAAGRELEEEVGVRAARIEHLASAYNSPGFCDQESLIFLGTGLSPVGSSRHGVEEEHIEVVEVPLGEVEAMVADGRLADALSVLGLLLARRRLEAGS